MLNFRRSHWLLHKLWLLRFQVLVNPVYDSFVHIIIILNYYCPWFNRLFIRLIQHLGQTVSTLLINPQSNPVYIKLTSGAHESVTMTTTLRWTEESRIGSNPKHKKRRRQTLTIRTGNAYIFRNEALGQTRTKIMSTWSIKHIMWLILPKFPLYFV